MEMSTPPTSPTFTTSFRRNRSYPTQLPHALRCATLTAAPEPPRSDYYRQRFGGGCFCMSAISAEIPLSKERPVDNLQIATRDLQNKPAHRRLALVNHTNFIKAMYFSLIISGGRTLLLFLPCETPHCHHTWNTKKLVSKQWWPCVDIKSTRNLHAPHLQIKRNIEWKDEGSETECE